jgi:hypothetical protein
MANRRGFFAYWAMMGLLPAQAIAAENEARPARDRFGTRGQVAIGGDFTVRADNVNVEDYPGQVTFYIAPAADFFVVQHFSIGGRVSYEIMGGSVSGYGAVGLAPRVGYAVSLSDQWSLYPRLSLGYEHIFGAYGADVARLEAFVPVLVHPVDHFFLGLGPFASRTLVSENNANGTATMSTTLGLQSSVGGYF